MNEYQAAAQKLLDRLRAPARAQAEAQQPAHPVPPTHVVINRPQNCVIVINGTAAQGASSGGID